MKVPPGNWFAPPGSNPSSGESNEAAEASDGKGRFRRLSERAGRNNSERRAGPETENAGADPPELWGRPTTMKEDERKNFIGPAGVFGDGMQAKGIRRNTGNPGGDRNKDQPATRERQAGPSGVTERSVVPVRSGNADGGKGPQLKGNATSDTG